MIHLYEKRKVNGNRVGDVYDSGLDVFSSENVGVLVLCNELGELQAVTFGKYGRLGSCYCQHVTPPSR